MGPGGIASGDHQKVSLFQVFVASRYRITANRPFVRSNSRRHTKAGVCIHICATDKALHQLVGNVVIFSQQLAGTVESHGLRAMGRNHLTDFICHQVQSCVPVCSLSVHCRVEQAVGVSQRVMQCGAFNTQASEISRVRLHAGNGSDIFLSTGDIHATAYSTVGACCLNL